MPTILRRRRLVRRATTGWRLRHECTKMYMTEQPPPRSRHPRRYTPSQNQVEGAKVNNIG